VPRIVADTNVYISALNFGGTADDVLALGRAGMIEICISRVILDEITGVLAHKFRWSRARVREASAAIRHFTLLVHPKESLNVVREDEPDNRILECALAARADTIVTGDHHLLQIKRFRGLRITAPREFLATVTRR
jgi:putative PIN family toxin of toxin-antitoxin system